MQLKAKLPEIQGALPKFVKTWVVLGPNHPDKPGQIKTVRMSGNVTSALVDVKYDYRGERIVGIKGVQIHVDEEANGSRFLQELYEEAGRMEDFELFCAHQKAIEDGRDVDPFPEDRLPPVVLQWRSRKGSIREKFVIPPRESTPAEPAADPVEKPLRRRSE